MPEPTPYLARLRWHPDDREVVTVEIPQDLNQAMGTFEPARLVPELRAYAMHHNAIPAFFRWARHQGVHVVDERTKGGGAVRRVLPVECSTCGQPGRLEHPPTRCPSCGEPWRPVTPPGHVTANQRTTTPCPACHHAESGRFPFCSNCGARMVHKPGRAPRASTHPVFKDPETTPRLDDPLPLADAMVMPEKATPPW